MKNNILVTGGAGYIGSHAVKQLLETTKHNIIIVDNLSTGNLKTIKTLKLIRDFKFIKLDLKELDKVKSILKDNNIDTIMHFAAKIIVPESIKNPIDYYINNTVNTINLIKIAVDMKVKKIIFSSSAAVYGEPDKIPEDGIDENFQTNPINPYGMSKLMSENIIKDVATVNDDFKYVIFRYFNVAGADINYVGNNLTPRIGQSFPNATNLIKIASLCATKKIEKMDIFGDDYDTFDGTQIRDYIHVDDLADAHIKAIDYLNNNSSDIFNVGYSNGFSVKEAISSMKKVTKEDFKVNISSRRAGDPVNVVSNNTKIKNKMGWTPKYNDLDLICKSSYEWEKRYASKTI